ncbi:MAG: NAD(P)H-dependent oxidoreductase [Ruminococcus sp.]|nr:NAD(P)H-dependent oxidoreductase [Ruminococcus sp.]
MSKNLVLFFSVYESTKAVAEEIAAQTGADLVEIEPVTPYDSNRSHYNALARYAKKEHDEDMRPAIKNEINIENYDNIFIGYPMWWYTFPMIIYTLFDKYDFSGKTIIPFNTHMGSGDGGTYRTITQLEPNATVLNGLPVEMSEAERGCKDKVEKWLNTTIRRTAK